MKIVAKTTPQLMILRAGGTGITKEALAVMKGVCKARGLWFSWGMKAWCIQKSDGEGRQKILSAIWDLQQLGFFTQTKDLHDYLNGARNEGEEPGTTEIGEGGNVEACLTSPTVDKPQ